MSKCSGRMLSCDQTVQCFDCLRVWWGTDEEEFRFEMDHRMGWTILPDDAIKEPDYGALAPTRTRSHK